MTHSTVLEAERPRNVNKWRAAAILYGDWGTSKAYVIGLAFAIGGFSSFWLILGVSLLSICVGLNYITICKTYPNGGGVYSSVRHRSQVLALVGGMFLIADYIITAALSALSAFNYLGVSSPEICAIGAVIIIGALNFLGPKNTGSMAFAIAICAVITVFFLGAISIPHINQAINHVEPIPWGFELTWINFVGVIVALSGVEAIANTTGVMRLDPGSTRYSPSVYYTAKPAILMVMLEVCFFTTLFGLAVNALPNLTIIGNNVSAPGYENVRDAMLRYLAEVFSTPLVGENMAKGIGLTVSIIFCILLLSAVNTALVGLNSLLFVMSHDGQMPAFFQKINRFGVPYYSLALATFSSAIVLLLVHDTVGLANLYAVGFVGAIATNLGSTSTDFRLSIKNSPRFFMFITFLIMAAIEITLFFEKSEARAFVITVIAIGLLLRSMVLEQKDRFAHKPTLITISEAAKKALHPELKEVVAKPLFIPPTTQSELPLSPENEHLHFGAMLCATTHVGKALELALKESVANKQKLYVLFVREQKIKTDYQLMQHWVEDPQASLIFDHVLDYFKGPQFQFIYDVSNSPAFSIVEHAKSMKVSEVFLGMSRQSKLIRMIRGNVIADVRDHLPAHIDLIVVS